MFFRYALTIPAGTPELDPIELYCNLTHGIVTGVWVGFPAGCAATVRVRIYRQEHQLWPLNPGAYFAGDNYVFNFDERFELFQPPYQVLVRGSSPEAQQKHEVTICFEVFTTEETWGLALLESIFGSAVSEE